MTPWSEQISTLQASGLTYSQIGDAVGLATSTVGDLATGRTKSPRGDAAIKLHLLFQRVEAERDQGAGNVAAA